MIYTFTTHDQGDVELEWTCSDEMIVRTMGNPQEEIGHFTFNHVEGLSDDGSGDYYLVTYMHLEGPKGSGQFVHQGIGRFIIETVGEMEIPIVFSPDDGQRRKDGSHLTGNGPAFARKMVQEKLAHWDT